MSDQKASTTSPSSIMPLPSPSYHSFDIARVVDVGDLGLGFKFCSDDFFLFHVGDLGWSWVLVLDQRGLRSSEDVWKE